MTSLNLPHYRTFLVLGNMSVSVLIKAVIRSDGLSMAPPVAIAVGIFQGVRPRLWRGNRHIGRLAGGGGGGGAGGVLFHPCPGGLNLAGDYKR